MNEMAILYIHELQKNESIMNISENIYKINNKKMNKKQNY
jgi:hypothetical protein